MRTFAALLLSTAAALAQVQTYSNFFLSYRLPDVQVNATSQAISLQGAVPTPQVALVCDRGPEDIYAAMGPSNITVASNTGQFIRSGTCAKLSAVGFTNMALVSDSNIGATVSIMMGTGNP